MTALSGLPAYVDMAEVSGLVESVRTHMNVKKGDQGWTDAQMVMSLVLLNIAGGECVDDPRSSRGQALRILEKDEGLGRVLRRAETHRTRRAEREALEKKRWRRDRQRSVPSAQCAVSAVCRQRLRRSDISVSSTTTPRRTEGSRTKRSYRRPMMRWADSARSTPTWWASCRAIPLRHRRPWTWTPPWELVSNVVEIALQGIGRSGCLGCLLTRWEFDQHPVLKSSSIHQ